MATMGGYLGSQITVYRMIGRQPDFAEVYYDYADLLVIDPDTRLWHRRLKPCATEENRWFAVTQDGRTGAQEPDLTGTFFAAAVSAQTATLFLAVQSRGMLFASQPSPSDALTEGWKQIDIWIYPDTIFGLPDTSGTPIPVSLSSLSAIAGIPSSSNFTAVEIILIGADGNFYSRTTSQPADTGTWRKIDASGFTPLFGEEFVVTGDFLLALASDRSLWTALVDHSTNHISPIWQKVTPPRVCRAGSRQPACKVLVKLGRSRAQVQ